MGMVTKLLPAKGKTVLHYALFLDLFLLVQIISQSDNSLNSPQSREQNHSL